MVVLDDPLALKATINYFQENDPSLVSATERAMQYSDDPSVHGNMWETMMPPVFVEAFKIRPLSSWPLLNYASLPDQLIGEVTVVGYDERQPKLATSHRSITTLQFMKAHVEDNFKQGDEDVPPFYFPSPHISGPDIIFFVKIKGKIYPCFVQLKLRQILEPRDAEKALSTVGGDAVRGKTSKEQTTKKSTQRKHDSTSVQSNQQQPPPQLQDYCPNGLYISMVIAYPAEVVYFQAVRPDLKPKLEGLQRVSIRIDGDNFSRIFPRRHIEYLDNLKGHKRRYEDQQPQTSKKMKANDSLPCDK